MTIGGWKAFDVETAKKLNPDLNFTSQLKVGDVLIRENGEKEMLFKYDFEEQKTTVYNLKVDGDETYYADGYLVHNK